MKLEENGQRENTYVVFTADHGLSVGHHGLLGKQNMYDHSIRVPFAIAGPMMEAGKSEGREAIYTGYRMSQRQITDDGFKLIVSPRGQVARLFDHLNADPFEKYDLIEQGKQL